ncbi:MAG: aldo/keto reductase [Cyclobacteriaceae bacterium]|nr:aldo/keto reductase [Cyclobacteriaceae bacterium]
MEKRREFIKKVTGLTAAMMIPANHYTLASANSKDKWGYVLPKRLLGKTSKEVTMLGVGGYHIGWTTERNAQAVIEAALDGGIRFFDSAESYGPHTSEIRYGKYLTPKYRKEIFLMTKSTATDAKTMQDHLHASLDRLKTDYLDLWQIHAVSDPKDVDTRIANGVFDVVQKAKEDGIVRHVGFTGHQNPKAHLRVLEMTKDNPFLETIQMPINVVDANLDHFINAVFPLAIERNLGILAMKTMADGRFFANKMQRDELAWETDKPAIPDKLSIKDALYFVWSLPVSVLITGAENETFIKEKIELAKSFVQLNEEQRESLVARVSELAAGGEVEYYKDIN